MEARYLSVSNKSWDDLKTQLEEFLDGIGAEYDEFSEDDQRLLAILTSSFVVELTLTWEQSPKGNNNILLIFDFTSEDEMEIEELHDFAIVPAKDYFDQLILVYNSVGHVRHLEALPMIFNLENSFRELIVRILLWEFGSSWWEHVKPIKSNRRNTIKEKTEKIRGYESEEEFVKFYEFFHDIFYVDFDDLRKIMMEFMEKDANSLFHKVLGNAASLYVPGQVGLLKPLRNQVMHGKYLSQENINMIRTTWSILYRFLQRRNYIGDFDERSAE